MNLRTYIEHLIDTRSVGLGSWLYRRTGGRLTRLWRRRALLLTATGRRSGLPRTVILQFFPDGADMIVVAANSGLPRHPGWYYNLKAQPQACVEVEGRTARVIAKQLSPREAAEFWPHVLATAPDYARYRERTERELPLLRLVRVRETGWAPASAPDWCVDAGTWIPGMSYLRFGAGPPLLFLPGLTTHHGPPGRTDRVAAARSLRPLARARQIWWVNRRAGLPSDASMAALAADYVAGIRSRFDAPVDIIGVSTGGGVGLQLAADHPELVRRLVLVSAGCRLGPRGLAAQRLLAEAVLEGDHRQAGAAMLSVLGSRTTTWAWKTVGWLLGPVMFRRDPQDLLTTLQAEDAFDLTGRLPEISIPVLVVGGAQDQPYGQAVFEETVRGLPRGRLLLYRHTSHFGVQARPRLIRDVLNFLDEDDNDLVASGAAERRKS